MFHIIVPGYDCFKVEFYHEFVFFISLRHTWIGQLRYFEKQTYNI